MYSIYDKFLTIQSCDYYTQEIADRLNLKTFSYYYDNVNKIQIPANVTNDICSWLGLDVPNWRRTFNLCNSTRVMKIGLDNYVLSNRELNFYLTVKGKSIIYAVKFIKDNALEKDQNPLSLIKQEDDGQLRFILT